MLVRTAVLLLIATLSVTCRPDYEDKGDSLDYTARDGSNDSFLTGSFHPKKEGSKQKKSRKLKLECKIVESPDFDEEEEDDDDSDDGDDKDNDKDEDKDEDKDKDNDKDDDKDKDKDKDENKDKDKDKDNDKDDHDHDYDDEDEHEDATNDTDTQEADPEYREFVHKTLESSPARIKSWFSCIFQLLESPEPTMSIMKDCCSLDIFDVVPMCRNLQNHKPQKPVPHPPQRPHRSKQPKPEFSNTPHRGRKARPKLWPSEM